MAFAVPGAGYAVAFAGSVMVPEVVPERAFVVLVAVAAAVSVDSVAGHEMRLY